MVMNPEIQGHNTDTIRSSIFAVIVPAFYYEKGDKSRKKLLFRLAHHLLGI
jgi:hypothetical protein